MEYRSKSLCIQTVLPNHVRTKLSVNFLAPLVSVTPEDYVRSAIRTVGIESYTYGHWKHKLVAYLTDLLMSTIGVSMFMKLSFMYFNMSRIRYYKNNNLL